MEFVTMLFNGALDIYLHIVIFVKGFYTLFLGKSTASFATGMTILFVPVAWTSVVRTGSYSFFQKITNFSLWLISFVFTLIWLSFSKDGDIGLSGIQRYNGSLSFFIFLFAAYVGYTASNKAALLYSAADRMAEEVKKN